MIRANFEQSRALDRLGEGLRVLMLAAPDAAGRDALTARLQATGAQVEPADEIYAALGDLLDDPCDYGLFVMDCDSFGGIQAGRRAAALVGQLNHPVQVILLTRDCAEQHFPRRLARTGGAARAGLGGVAAGGDGTAAAAPLRLGPGLNGKGRAEARPFPFFARPEIRPALGWSPIRGRRGFSRCRR